MIVELKDTAKVEALFAGMEDSMIRSCLQRVMGRIVVTDPEAPRSALACAPYFVFCAGEPDRELAAWKPRGPVCVVPPDERWAALLETCWPGAARTTRYAIRKDTQFNRQKLERLRASLPEGYVLKQIDGAIYEMCLADSLFADCVGNFGSKARFFELGRGFAVLKDGRPVSVASSFSVYREGLEVEIDTAEGERRRGLAGAVGAALILSCLDDGLYPSWDAANLASVRLAEKLGYTFSHEYPCYWLDEPQARAIENTERKKASCRNARLRQPGPSRNSFFPQEIITDRHTQSSR